MDAKLIKVDNGWVLMVNNIMYATDENAPYARLSVKNCEAIVNGYDLDELANKYISNNKIYLDNYKEESHSKVSFIDGFQKALEILGDKKFTINEVVELCKILMSNPFETYQELTDNYIQSLQQTEWDVIIKTTCDGMVTGLCCSEVCDCNIIPKLDANGCLILKRK